jgi:hypothetical protein
MTVITEMHPVSWEYGAKYGMTMVLPSALRKTKCKSDVEDQKKSKVTNEDIDWNRS